MKNHKILNQRSFPNKTDEIGWDQIPLLLLVLLMGALAIWGHPNTDYEYKTVKVQTLVSVELHLTTV